MTHRIVFVEDDADLAELISDFLSRHEMEVVIEPRGDAALDTIAREAPDMVLLDIMLPGKDGLSICRELRPKFDGPIIMLTSLDSDMNQILGLELGANDYILKTTPPSVLVARLRAQLRNLRPAQPVEAQPAKGSRKAVFGQLSIDPVSRDVVLAGEKIPLSTSDFDLLWLLASHAGETLNRDLLLKEMRGVDYDGLDRSIDVAISRLRKKLGDNPSEPFRIKTVRNRGYLFSLSGWE
ncbi:two-component system response regulator RstA [Chromobacterium vaccinii]|uniref:Two-component system response regulator RstA n=1 Tax=Chromobacterium vaccinii TaxID=1108595 RepID=A0ABV0FDA7_9NEIS|nr:MULTISPECIES: two-component system response regulator RstA [Chromobacterium]MBX9295213.1 two-component system response regulator RstA [Chromobacterium vaccinii]MBX9346314.1 two-component system response regulator RstA [Chromobacterium vaccinii]MBX9357462.1 two-component system response regulator RstA [Chromobacterium vaccinii]MCD4483157.1 two-component system response regulator RstA [Chromobacterium vaccinii]MCD4499044.1 two-component system response regulator RstA [Chromobacterium vaccinii